MINLTKNKGKVLDFLIRNFTEKNSIRTIAREVSLSAMGAQKILKEFEKEDITTKEKIGTGIFYSINLKNERAFKLAELILMQKNLNPYARIYSKDLESLKNYSKVCILFGSILTKGEKAKDIDVFVLINKDNFKNIEKQKKELSGKSTKPFHFVYQTKKDFEKNIKIRDPTILDIIKKGVVLWGEEVILKIIKNGK